MSVMLALCQEVDGNIDEEFHAQLNSFGSASNYNFHVPSEARELFTEKEIEQRQLIAQQWFSKQQMLSGY
jgi:hypothetical protein